MHTGGYTGTRIPWYVLIGGCVHIWYLATGWFPAICALATG